ncbi:hypothetical protein Q5752_003601 [Cryptotrichosporon argae]
MVENAAPAHTLPLSALLAPLSAGPPTPFPAAAALLGPLAPSCPLHLALGYLESTELDDFEPSFGADRKGKGRAVNTKEGPKTKRPDRVVVVTGKREDWHTAIEDEDEDWLRDHGAKYDVLSRLRRVDVKYCPSAEHVRLLLTLLSTATDAPDPTAHLVQAPALIILWDVARLLMDDVEPDENVRAAGEADAESAGASTRPARKFRWNATIADYVDILAATKATAKHFSAMADTPTQLVVLEPSLAADASLPILVKGADVVGDVPGPQRERRVAVADAIRWVFGERAVGVVTPGLEEDGEAVGTLEAFGARARMRRTRCGRSEYAVAMPADGEGEGSGLDAGGWRWEWCL